VSGFAKHMRALPTASFIGFMGTPIERGDKSTKAVFGRRWSDCTNIKWRHHGGSGRGRGRDAEKYEQVCSIMYGFNYRAAAESEDVRSYPAQLRIWILQPLKPRRLGQSRLKSSIWRSLQRRRPPLP